MAGIFLLGQAQQGPTGRSVMGFTNGDSGFLKNFMQMGASFNSFGFNILPYLDSDGLPNLNGGNPSNSFLYTVVLPSDLVANSSPGANNGTQIILSWTGGATNASGAMGIDYGGTGMAVSLASDPDSLAVSVNPHFFLSNNVGRTSGGKIVFYFDSLPTSKSFDFKFFGGSTFASLGNLVIARAADWATIVDGATLAMKSGLTPEDMIYQGYVDVYNAANPSIFRTMGHSNPNDGNNCSRFTFRKSWKTGIGLCGAQSWRPECVAGDNGSGKANTSGTNTYTCAAASGTPSSVYVDGETIQVNFVNAGTGGGPFTLNVNSKGAKTLIDNQSSSISSISANTMATCVYDAIMDAFFYTADGMSVQTPYELSIALANRCNKHLWLNFPPFYDATSAAAVATLAATQLRTTSSCWFEFANEVWNFGFPFTHYAGAQGQALGLGSNDDRSIQGLYGTKVAMLMPGVKTAWTNAGRSATQCNRVLAFKAYGDPFTVEHYRMKGEDLAPSGTHGGTGNSRWNSYTGSADFTQAGNGNRPVDVTEVLSYAVYYGGAQGRQFDGEYTSYFDSGYRFPALLQAADDYASGNPTQMASALAFMDSDTRAGTFTDGTHTISDNCMSDFNGTTNSGHDIYNTWNALAVTYNRPVDLYEAGYSTVTMANGTCTHLGVSTGYTASITNLLEAYKNTTAFYNTTQLQFQQFMAKSKSRTACWLLFCGSHAGPNAWSFVKDDSLTTGSKYKSYDMYKDWNSGIG